MKIHNLISYTILETEDNMFPGIGPSAFGKRKSTPQEDLTTLEKQQDKLRIILRTRRDQIERLEQHLEDNDAYTFSPSSPPGPGEVRYEDFDWLKKYPEAAVVFDGHLISKTSPLFKNIENQIKNLNHHLNRRRDLLDQLRKIRGKIKVIQKADRKVNTENAGKAFRTFVKLSPQLPVPSPMPKTIPGGSARPLANPYVHPAAQKEYAGHVAHYLHWTNYWKLQIIQMEEILKRNGKGGLEMMYASTHQSGGGRFNFIIIGGRGTLTWRKYDPSPGAGQNWLYIGGKKMNTSSLFGISDSAQDSIVQALK